MLSFDVYKIVHFFGMFSLFFAYGGLLMFHHMGGPKTAPARKKVAILHGIALFLILLGGFGMLARLEMHFPFPLWIWIKLAVWLAMGGLVVVARKKADKIWPVYFLVVITGLIAAISAVVQAGRLTPCDSECSPGAATPRV